jgi:hypothetical protein
MEYETDWSSTNEFDFYLEIIQLNLGLNFSYRD